MTHNQIEYFKVLELSRANRKQEELTQLRDQRSYELGQATLAEQQRHSLVQEKQNQASLDETSRANIAREANTMAQIAISAAQLDEAKRSNIARESESQRHNVAVELETKRANQALEAETHRRNVRAEEQRQHEIANDQLRISVQRDVGMAQVGATLAGVAVQQQQANETARANRAYEAEQQRYHTLTTSETTRSNKAREAENTRANIARENENQRSNLASESIARQRNTQSWLTGQGTLSVRRDELEEAKRANQAQESAGRARNFIMMNRNINDLFLSGARTAVGVFGGY